MTIAKVTSQHKRSTENLERTQRFSLGWEEMKAKALDWLKFPPWPSGEGGTQGPGETLQKLGSNGIMSKKKSDMKKRSFCNLARMSDWRITLSRNWQIVKPACTCGSFQLGISGPVREVMAFFLQWISPKSSEEKPKREISKLSESHEMMGFCVPCLHQALSASPLVCIYQVGWGSLGLALPWVDCKLNPKKF